MSTERLFPGPYDPERLAEAFTEASRRFWQRENRLTAAEVDAVNARTVELLRDQGFSVRVAVPQERPRLTLIKGDAA